MKQEKRLKYLPLATPPATLRVEVDSHVIESAPYLRYLGVVIDARITFEEHLNSASERAMKAIFAFFQKCQILMEYTKRKLLVNVASCTPNMG